MKKIAILIAIVMVIPLLCGFGQKPATSKTAATAAYPYLIDNYEDGTYTKDPEWFVFDNVIPTIVKNSKLQEGDVSVIPNIGIYSLNLKGSASNWYVGGMGSMLGIDASGYTSFEIDIYGKGEGSGRLKVELYDDDNNNSEVEVDKNWKPLYDDLWSTDIEVNWKGWKHLSIPFSKFKNVGRGNFKFDPALSAGSGGLVKMQLISVAASETGQVNYYIDNLELGLK
ncbi:MAG: CIA30 family protein [Candidatus Saganbacteria bacterium]|nr:CIA30 family protein [Candidatus Saganbacteria bacterium]